MSHEDRPVVSRVADPGRRRGWPVRARSAAALPELRLLRQELANLVHQKARLSGLQGTAAERLRREIEGEIRLAWRVLGLAALSAATRDRGQRLCF